MEDHDGTSADLRQQALLAPRPGFGGRAVGDGEGQVPLRKLVRHVTKLPKGLRPAEMTDVLNRLKAIDATRSSVPLPKGPVPTSMKGMRGNLRGR